MSFKLGKTKIEINVSRGIKIFLIRARTYLVALFLLAAIFGNIGGYEFAGQAKDLVSKNLLSEKKNNDDLPKVEVDEKKIFKSERHDFQAGEDPEFEIAMNADAADLTPVPDESVAGENSTSQADETNSTNEVDQENLEDQTAQISPAEKVEASGENEGDLGNQGEAHNVENPSAETETGALENFGLESVKGSLKGVLGNDAEGTEQGDDAIQADQAETEKPISFFQDTENEFGKLPAVFKRENFSMAKNEKLSEAFWERMTGLFGTEKANAANSKIMKTEVLDAAGNVDEKIQTLIEESASPVKIKVLKPERAFKPGKYSLRVEMLSVDGTQILTATQDFTWGVLAINTNKSIYSPNEMAKLQFGVLDEKGEMVCDAKLKLWIRKQGVADNNQKSVEEDLLSTENGKIEVDKDVCQSKEFTLTPDYAAEYKVGGWGKYEMALTAETPGGTYTIFDSFEASNLIPFDVERTTATRIFPENKYPVIFDVTSNQAFTGEIRESVPASFEITKGDEKNYKAYDRVETKGETKILIWDANFKTEEKIKLGYEYDAPDESPQFYMLGPLQFREKDSLVFEEARQWQIAVDSIAAAYATRLYTTGFERNSMTANHEITGTSGTAPTISSSTYRSGAYAMRANPSGATSIAYADYAAADTGTARQIVRAYIRVATLPSVETVVLAFYDGTALGTAQASIRLNNSGDLKVYNEEDGTQVGSTLTGAVATNTWYRLELKYDFGTAATGDTAIAGMIDGNVFASSTTQNHANGTRRIGWGVITSTSGDLYFDDIGLNTDSTATVDNWVGDGKVVILLPDGNNAPGTPWDINGGGTAVQAVDDPPSSGFDDATTYLDCSTNTTSSTYDFTLTSSSSAGIGATDRIRLVEGWSRGRSSTATASSHALQLYNGSVLDPATAVQNSIASASWWTNDDTVPRNSSAIVYEEIGAANYTALTPALVDSASVRLTTTDCNPEHQVTAVWALVEYVPAEGGRLWSSGFELQNNPINTEEWNTVAGTINIDTTTKRSGDASARVQSLGSGTEESVAQTFAAANSDGPYYFRTYLNITTAPASGQENRIFEFKDSGGTARAWLTLANSSDGLTQSLKLFDEDGQVGSASSDLNTAQWYRVEVKYDSSGGASADTVEARIDGTNFATSSTRDLTNGVTQIVLGGNLNGEAQTTGDWYFDDVALNNGNGATQTGYPGSGKIVHLRPNADGDIASGWANGYANIDETDPNDATAMITSSTVNAIEEVNLFNVSTVGIGSGDTIKLAAPGVRFNTSATATMAFNVRLKDNTGAPIMKSDQIVSANATWYTNKNTAPRPYPMTAYTRPYRNTAWTAADLDNAQIGVQETVDTTSSLQVTAMWLLVEYDMASISISGTADGSVGSTVKVAVDSTVQGQTTTIQAASPNTWSIANVTVSSGQTVTAWIDNVDDQYEATAVTKYDGSGNVSGMVLDANVLSTGSDDSTVSVSVTNMNQYDCNSGSDSGDEDVMHDAGTSSTLAIQGCSNTYTAEKINILSGDTLTVSGTETLTTYDLTITGTLTSGGRYITLPTTG